MGRCSSFEGCDVTTVCPLGGETLTERHGSYNTWTSKNSRVSKSHAREWNHFGRKIILSNDGQHSFRSAPTLASSINNQNGGFTENNLRSATAKSSREVSADTQLGQRWWTMGQPKLPAPLHSSCLYVQNCAFNAATSTKKANFAAQKWHFAFLLCQITYSNRKTCSVHTCSATQHVSLVTGWLVRDTFYE